jgi:3-oxoacyl-[acyl-carrier-protein] synthase II
MFRTIKKIAGVIREFDPETYMERRDVRKMDRFCQFPVAAAKPY